MQPGANFSVPPGRNFSAHPAAAILPCIRIRPGRPGQHKKVWPRYIIQEYCRPQNRCQHSSKTAAAR